MKKLHLVLLLCLVPWVAWAQDDTSLSVERLWQLQRIGTPVTSNDGRFIVAPVTGFDVKADKGHTRLWLFSADGKQQTPLTAEGLRASEPMFSPDGNTLAFISQRDKDDAGQVYLLSMTKPGEAQRLTQVPTGVYGIKWVGKHLYFISRIWPGKSWDEMAAHIKAEKDNKMSAKQWNALPYSYFDHWIDENRQAHLFRIAATGGEVQPLTQPLGQELPRSTQGSDNYDIDAKEQYLAFTANGSSNQIDPNIDIFIARIGSDKADNLTSANQVFSTAMPLLWRLLAPTTRAAGENTVRR